MLRLHWCVLIIEPLQHDTTDAANSLIRETCAQNIRGLHNPKHSFDGASLHRMGKKLPLPVSVTCQPMLRVGLTMRYSQLYGADDEAEGQELDDAEKNGENGQQIRYFSLRSGALTPTCCSKRDQGAA